MGAISSSRDSHHMPRLSFLLCSLPLMLAGCGSSPKPVERSPFSEETLECSNYRGMMTAPMPPSEVEKLRVACEQSRARTQPYQH